MLKVVLKKQSKNESIYLLGEERMGTKIGDIIKKNLMDESECERGKHSIFFS